MTRAGALRLAQSPLWGFGRVAAMSIRTCRLPAGRSGDVLREEIEALPTECTAAVRTRTRSRSTAS